VKIGLNTNVYIEHSLDYVLSRVKSLGYEGIEIARVHPIHELPEDKINEYRKLISKAGLEVYSIQGGIPFTDPEFCKKRIELARLLDCRNVNMGPGIEIDAKDSIDEAWEKTLKVFTEIAEYAKKYGINVNIEPEPKAPLSTKKPTITTYEQAERMLQELRMNNVGLVLDIVHTFVSKENIFQLITKFMDKIKVIHVGDTLDGRHLHLIPGIGEINFEPIFKALIKNNYKGYLSVEIYPYFDIPDEASFRSILYLQGIIQKVL
jgi:sugar phosphate isomerase/epimerase